MVVNGVQQIIVFLREIGLEVREAVIEGATFLPGICASKGELVVDLQALRYPGDLLHEAGHIAILPPARRYASGSDFGQSAGNEMAAIAWSYAACMHLELPVDMLFHSDGYKGEAEWLRDTFSRGHYIGVPMLVWKSMTTERGPKAYPAMHHWLNPGPN